MPLVRLGSQMPQGIRSRGLPTGCVGQDQAGPGDTFRHQACWGTTDDMRSPLSPEKWWPGDYCM